MIPFHQIPEPIAERRDIGWTEKAVFLYLLTLRRLATLEGKRPAWPSADDLDAKLAIPRATGYRALKKLQARELVRRTGDTFELLDEAEWGTERGLRKRPARFQSQNETGAESQNETTESQNETGAESQNETNQSQNETNQSQNETRTFLIERSEIREAAARARDPEVQPSPPGMAATPADDMRPAALWRRFEETWRESFPRSTWPGMFNPTRGREIESAQRKAEGELWAEFEAYVALLTIERASQPRDLPDEPWKLLTSKIGTWREKLDRARKGKRPGVGRPAKAGQYPAAPHERFRDGGSADAALQRLGAAFDLEWFDVGGEAPTVHKHRDELEQAFKAFPRELKGEDLEAHFARELKNYLAQRPLIVGASPESRAASAAAFCEWFTAARRPVQAMEAAR